MTEEQFNNAQIAAKTIFKNGIFGVMKYDFRNAPAPFNQIIYTPGDEYRFGLGVTGDDGHTNAISAEVKGNSCTFTCNYDANRPLYKLTDYLYDEYKHLPNGNQITMSI
jgi:hypothetical protein